MKTSEETPLFGIKSSICSILYKWLSGVEPFIDPICVSVEFS